MACAPRGIKGIGNQRNGKGVQMYLILVIPLLAIGGIVGLMFWAAIRDSKREHEPPCPYKVEVEKEREALR